MFRFPLRGLLYSSALAVLLIGIVVAFLCYSDFTGSGTLPNGIEYTRYTMETTRPLSLDDARKHWKGFAFPDSATNIHIAAYYEWQAAVEVIRFEAPVEDCLAAARQITQTHNATGQTNQTGDVQLDLRAQRMQQIAPLKAPWFVPDTIRVGQTFAGAGTGEYRPQIWVDTERGILYFHRSK